MNFTSLKHIRQHLYESLERGADALFNLGDALLCESQAQSLPDLSIRNPGPKSWPAPCAMFMVAMYWSLPASSSRKRFSLPKGVVARGTKTAGPFEEKSSRSVRHLARRC